jgi:DNA invertase Pin-like site-specific DNA recombinase
VAYSYIRFSHPDQAKGDSLRRQTAAAAEWCARNAVRLDTSTTLHDLGRSAFTGAHRTNPDRHALAAFLKLVEAGRVPRGSYLVVENLDRLSREDIQPALLLALNLMQAGVRIVQLKPVEMVFDDKSDTMPVMMMIMELSRGHSESAIKSERVGAAWAQRKKAAREGADVLTRRLPAWVEERGGKLVLIPSRAAAVRRVFALAGRGFGHTAIVRRLTAEQVPPLGTAGHWARSYVNALLADRRAVGELQPKTRRGKTADGAAVPGYFPAVVTEEEWLAARAVAASRPVKATRGGKHLDLFSGLVRNATDGGGFYAVTRHGRRNGAYRVLVNTAGAEGRAPQVSFPLPTFERAVLSLLAEVDPRDVTGRKRGPDEVMVLGGELERVEASIALIEAEMDERGESPTLFKRLRAKEDEKRTLAGRLAEARRKAAHPLSEAWGQAHTLLAALDAAPDREDARLRLRSLLRRVVEEVRLLIVPRGPDRLAAVQVFFVADGCRSYLIFHRAARFNGRQRLEGSWRAKSLADVVDSEALDLRRAEDAAALEVVLREIDLARLAVE